MRSLRQSQGDEVRQEERIAFSFDYLGHKNIQHTVRFTDGAAEGKNRGITIKGPEHTKETKTTEELERMILEDLRNVVDGCPERGVNVTVYGIPWNAMLTFAAAAGPVRNKAELKKFFEIITERLQRVHDMA